MDSTFILTSVAVFTGVIVFLVIGLMIAAKKLQPGGTVKIDINDGGKLLELEPGGSLLSALAGQSIFLPSACGGGGTCAMCRCNVLEGGGALLPTEAGYISKSEAKEGQRLGCQVKVKSDMRIEVPDEVLEIKKFEGTVVSNHNVATFIKEFVVKLPEGMDLNHKAGGYIQIDIPPYDVSFKDFDIEEEYRADWDKFKLWDVKAKNSEEVFRAYSMANHPAEGNIVMLNIRIATAPFNKPTAPPGIASSFIFNCKPGDKVVLSGPFGEFFINDSDREMVYIGGGAGMAPLRSHIFHLFHTLKTGRKVSYWYGARSSREMFYEEDFRAIEREFPNFSFHIAMSDPQPEDKWEGPTGFIHSVVLDNYLDKHEDPSEVEYYMCGPPMMISAVNSMLYDLGVEKDMIWYDEF